MIFGQFQGLNAVGCFKNRVSLPGEQLPGQSPQCRGVLNQQDRFIAGEFLGSLSDAILVERVARAGQMQLEDGANARFAVDGDVAAVLLDDAIDRRQSQSRSLASSL